MVGGAACGRGLACLALRLLRRLPAWRFLCVPDGRQVTGLSFDGGYADYMIAPATAWRWCRGTARADAAPLMCAGVTTFNALRNSGARPGEVVAVLGLGGLGHLGVQYAAKMGFRTVAIARGKDKECCATTRGNGLHRQPVI